MFSGRFSGPFVATSEPWSDAPDAALVNLVTDVVNKSVKISGRYRSVHKSQQSLIFDMWRFDPDGIFAPPATATGSQAGATLAQRIFHTEGHNYAKTIYDRIDLLSTATAPVGAGTNPPALPTARMDAATWADQQDDGEQRAWLFGGQGFKGSRLDVLGMELEWAREWAAFLV